MLACQDGPAVVSLCALWSGVYAARFLCRSHPLALCVDKSRKEGWNAHGPQRRMTSLEVMQHVSKHAHC